jgi:hypothetical protein
MVNGVRDAIRLQTEKVANIGWRSDRLEREKEKIAAAIPYSGAWGKKRYEEPRNQGCERGSR